MNEIVTVNTYELGKITGELVKVEDHLIVIKTEDGEYVKMIKWAYLRHYYNLASSSTQRKTTKYG